MFGPQWSDCLGRIRMCDFVDRDVTLGTFFEVSNQLLTTPMDHVSSQLLLQHHAYLLTALLPVLTVMDPPPETVIKLPIKYFFYKLPW